MNVEKLLAFVRQFNIDRQANLITVNIRNTKKMEKFFHADTSEKAEEMLQEWIKQICKE